MTPERPRQTRAEKPSRDLALVCAAIVSSWNRSWLAKPISELAQLDGEDARSPERLSRLKARLCPRFEALLTEYTRVGRSPREPDPSDESAVLRELLKLVPLETWTRLRHHDSETTVAAQVRLNTHHGLKQAPFCEMLCISERTFRSWKARARAGVAPSESPAAGSPSDDSEHENAASGDLAQPNADSENAAHENATHENAAHENAARENANAAHANAAHENVAHENATRRARGIGRFDLCATLPGIQLLADTSKWNLFGVPLYIVAMQDPGWRAKRLWESFAVSEKEDSELIVRTLESVLQPGMQFVCDQGTPYMSERTRAAVESCECEHAPQKEGTPTEKATKERAFRTVKDALEPLAELSRRVASRFPALRDGEFAIAAGRLLLSVFLRVYESAARHGGHPLAGRDAEELDAIAQEQREKARAEKRSTRLALEAIHREYRMAGSSQSFVRAHGQHALEDIQEAERRLRPKAGNSTIKDLQRFFAGILRNVRQENLPKRARGCQERKCRSEQQRRLAAARVESEERAALLRERPEVVLSEGLDMVNVQWVDRDEALYLGGRGFGRARIRDALRSMRSTNEYTVEDRATAVWTAWLARNKLPPRRRDAVFEVLEGLVAESLPGAREGPHLSELFSASAR